MRLNTELYRWLGCPLSLHKFHVDPATRTDEAADFWHRHQEITSPHFSRLTKHDQEIRDSVLSLGFVNHRTRTLEDVAQILGEDHGDSVPASLKELQRPWRIGPYSARATMIFAFHEPMALVDTNFARVGERVFGYNMPSQPHKSEEVYQFFDALMPDNPGLCRALNLALLDLADAICTPSDPSCPSCPLATSCLYWKENRR